MLAFSNKQRKRVRCTSSVPAVAVEEVRFEEADSEYPLIEALLDHRSWWVPRKDALPVEAGPRTRIPGMTAESGEEAAVVESSKIVVGVSGGRPRETCPCVESWRCMLLSVAAEP